MREEKNSFEELKRENVNTLFLTMSRKSGLLEIPLKKAENVSLDCFIPPSAPNPPF